MNCKKNTNKSLNRLLNIFENLSFKEIIEIQREINNKANQKNQDKIHQLKIEIRKKLSPDMIDDIQLANLSAEIIRTIKEKTKRIRQGSNQEKRKAAENVIRCLEQSRYTFGMRENIEPTTEKNRSKQLSNFREKTIKSMITSINNAEKPLSQHNNALTRPAKIITLIVINIITIGIYSLITHFAEKEKEEKYDSTSCSNYSWFNLDTKSKQSLDMVKNKLNRLLKTQTGLDDLDFPMENKK